MMKQMKERKWRKQGLCEQMCGFKCQHDIYWRSYATASQPRGRDSSEGQLGGYDAL